MGNSKKHRRWTGLLCGVILLLLLFVHPEVLWAEQGVDTLKANGDGVIGSFSVSGCENHYACVDDPSHSCDATVEAEYLFTSTAAQSECFKISEPSGDDTTGKDIDSLAMEIEADYNQNGAGGNAKFEYGWYYKFEGAWYWGTQEGGTDTVEMVSTDCAVFRVVWSVNPCWGSDWEWDAVYLNDDINDHHQIRIRNESNRTGCLPTCYNNLLNVRIIVYWTKAVAGGNPRRRRMR